MSDQEQAVIDAIKNHPFCREIIMSADGTYVSMWATSENSDLAAFLKARRDLSVDAVKSLYEQGVLYIPEYFNGIFGSVEPRPVYSLVRINNG